MIPLFDRNPTARAPVVTRLLILANVVAGYLEWQRGAAEVIQAYGFVPARALISWEAELPQVFSSMFLHANLAHLAWNMLFLHIFGDNVEDALGRFRYLVFYLVSGACGALAQYVLSPSSTIPMVGASGAIAGVLAGYVILHPRAPIVHLNPIPLFWLFMGPFLPLPAWFVVGYWFFINLLEAFASLGETGAGVAFFAHLGGFFAGLLLTRPFLSGAVPRAEDEEIPSEPFSRTSPPRSRPTRGRTSSRPAPAPQSRVFWKTGGGPFWRS